MSKRAMRNKKEHRSDESIERWITDHIDVATRTVLLNGAVDDDMLELVVKSLLLFEGQGVTFYLNSTGGEETSGLAICDLLIRHKGQINMIVTGSAESMAAVILQTASSRLITRNSFIMIHQGEVSIPDGHKKNVRAFLKISDSQDEICDSIVLKRIQEKHKKYSWAKFRTETHFDVYFTAEQALQWGLVDKVIE